MKQHIPEDAADARHDTPASALDVVIAIVRQKASGGYWATQTRDHVLLLVNELERLRAELYRLRNHSAACQNGLRYADPGGRFSAWPSDPNFTGEGLSRLELRVLAAHLTTALDTVHGALKKQGTGA